MVNAWLIYVGRCIVMLWWISDPPEASAIRQLLQEIVIYVRLLSFCFISFTVHRIVSYSPNPYALFTQSLADSCFPISEGPSAGRLHGILLFFFFFFFFFFPFCFFFFFFFFFPLFFPFFFFFFFSFLLLSPSFLL